MTMTLAQKAAFNYKETQFAFDIDNLTFAVLERHGAAMTPVQLAEADIRHATDSTAVAGINFITLNIAHDCNMACPYCFAKQGLYGGARKLMNAETAKRSVDWLVSQSGDKKDCYLRFLGGEPLMNLPVLESTIQYALQKGAENGKDIHFSINTNGTIFNDTVARLLREYSIIVSISMDGTEEAHNVHRIFPSGAGTYRVVANNLAKFLNCDPKVMINCTITADNVNVYEYAKLFRGFGINSVRFAIVGDPNHKIAVRTSDLLQRIRRSYDDLADLYLADLMRGDVWYLADFYKYFENLRGLKRRMNRCGAGTTYVNIDVEGDVHLCHRFTADDNQKIGSIQAPKLIAPEGIAQMNQLLPIMPNVPSLGPKAPDPIKERIALQAIHRRLDGSAMVPEVPTGKTVNLCSVCDIKYLCGGSCFHDGQTLFGSLHGGPDPFKCEVDRHLAKISMWLLDSVADRPDILAQLDTLHYQSIQHTN